MTKTIQRNYRKNPHTANFLMTFHAATAGLPADAPADDAEALAREAAQDDDLLNTIPVEAPAYQPSERQKQFITDLIREIRELDTEAGATALTWNRKMNNTGSWTRESVSDWIERLIAKRKALRTAAAAPRPAAPAGEVEIPAGRYAVETDEIRCYTVDYGKAGTRWEGFLFLNRISSDDRFPIKNPAAKAEILAAIRRNVEASAILAGLTLRQCRRCGRELSDTKNPYFHVALGPDCGSK